MSSSAPARQVCRQCHRPAATCLCRLFEGLTPVANRTGAIILQHPRERFHPLGTAPLALRGLQNARIEPVAVTASRSLQRPLTLPPRTGLLYPHPSARTLGAEELCSPPENLLLLDGTWHHARKLYQENPWLQALPHYQLRPSTPSRYRIRGEPDEQSLSTIEAIVCALRLLEPQTAGLDQLLGVFDAMIDRQLECIRSKPGGPRYRTRLKRRPAPLLLQAYQRLVVVYAELIPRQGGGRQPLYWLAQQPTTGKAFARFVRADALPPSAQQLAHMLLRPADLEQAIDCQQLTEQWNSFLGEQDVLAAWNQGVLDQALSLTRRPCQTLLLKAAYCNLAHQACGSLEGVLAREGLLPAATPYCGRAGQRLGQTLAVLQHLRQSAASQPAQQR